LENSIVEADYSSQQETIQIDSLEILKQYLQETGMYQIFFAYASHEANLSEEAIVHLQKIMEYLEIAPEEKVFIKGCSDSKGTSKFNLELSRMRAEFVQNKLVELGVKKNQIQISAKGEISTLENETENDRKKNRRTDIFIK